MPQRLLPIFLFTAIHGTAQPNVAAEDDPRTRTISSVRWFGMEDGLPDRKVNAITEDNLGFIWMATKQGLVRFDGDVFENHTRDHGLLQDAVTHVARDRDGLLWVMFMDSTVQLVDPFTRRAMGLDEHFGTRLPVDHRGPWSSLGASDDGLIVLGQNGHVVFYGGREQGYRSHPIRPSGLTQVLRVERNGDLWCNISGVTSHSYDLVRVSFAHGWRSGEAPTCTTVVRGIWHTGTGTDHSGARPDGPEGIYYGRFGIEGWAGPGGRIIPLPHRGEDLLPEAENRMHAHLGGDLWVVNARIRRMEAGEDPRLAEVVVDMHTMHPQAGHSVNAVLRDRAGRIWVGTDFGLLLVKLLPDRFQRWFRMDELVHGYGTRTRGMQVLDGHLFVNLENEGYLVADARSGTRVLEAGKPMPRGAVLAVGTDLVWECGTEQLVLRRVRDGADVRAVAPAPGHGYTWCGWQAQDGSFLLGTNAGLYRLGDAPETERVQQPLFPEASLTPVWHIAMAQGELLACTGSGLYVLDPSGSAIARYWRGADDPSHRLPAEDIRHLHVDAAGVHWLATATRGLVRWDRNTGTWRIYGPAQGMPQAAIHAVYPDSAGRLWMPTDNGLVLFQPQGERIEVFTALEGIAFNEFNRISHTRGPDGTLYFGGLNGITVFHPDRFQALARTELAPLMLKGIYVQPAEGQRQERTGEVLQGQELVMRPGDRFIYLDMALLSYDEPHLVRYAWRLDGIDEEWNIQHEPNLRFTTLPFGKHALRLRGMDREGRWSDELLVSIRVVRPVHLRWWFISGMVLVGAFIFYAGVSYRLMQRSRALIRREKEINEQLLHNILPVEVAGELKSRGEAEARLIEQVTVLFTDFKGFTAMSEKVTAKQLVKDLHECFSAFDHFCEEHGLEKIKTIGDAYMAAGGLPVANTTHARDAIEVAFKMRDFIAEGKARKIAAGLPYFEIRIGIHTGPVVAGIVGVKKFSYDIWGDTVNTASRMESSGEPGKVNISEATYAMVKDMTGLHFSPRGKVQAKGKGEMEMFFVERSTRTA